METSRRRGCFKNVCKDEEFSIKRMKRLCTLKVEDLPRVDIKIKLKFYKPEEVEALKSQEQKDDEARKAIDKMIKEEEFTSSSLETTVQPTETNETFKPPKDLKKSKFKEWVLSDDKEVLYIDLGNCKWLLYKLHQDGLFYCQKCTTSKRKSCMIIHKNDMGYQCLYGRDNHNAKCILSYTHIQQCLIMHPSRNLEPMKDLVRINYKEPERIPDDRWILLSENNVAKQYMYIISPDDKFVAAKFIYKGTTPFNDLIYLCEKCFNEGRIKTCVVSYSNKRVIVEVDGFEVHFDQCFSSNLIEVMKSENQVFVNTIIPLDF